MNASLELQGFMGHQYTGTLRPDSDPVCQTGPVSPAPSLWLVLLLFRAFVLLPPAGADGAAAGAADRPAGLHPGHGGVQEGLLLLQRAHLPSGLDWRAAAPSQLSSSSGPAPPQTAGMLQGETPLPLLLPCFASIFLSLLFILPLFPHSLVWLLPSLLPPGFPCIASFIDLLLSSPLWLPFCFYISSSPPSPPPFPSSPSCSDI